MQMVLLFSIAQFLVHPEFIYHYLVSDISIMDHDVSMYVVYIKMLLTLQHGGICTVAQW